jgi:hypothetical protein
MSKSTETDCAWCGKKFFKQASQIKMTKNNFCGKSCAASYNNTQKRKSRRSKCEKLLFELLMKEFADLIILPNNKTLLNGYEVDIAIPSLNLAIEWNGIVHFKPIYGEEKLQKIITRDQEKLIIAKEKNINLIVIPDLISKKPYVEEIFLKIRTIINNLKAAGGVEPPSTSFAGQPHAMRD